MALFRVDSLAVSYLNLEEAKQWWIRTFDCKVARVPPDWDNPLPSDVALKLPGESEPTILLNARAEVDQAGFETPLPPAFVIFCEKLKKGHEHLSSRGVSPGPIKDGGDMQFFEVHDLEGNLFEICREP